MEDPAQLDVELDVDAEQFRDEAAAAKRELQELRQSIDDVNEALDRLERRESVDVSVETAHGTEGDGQ